MYDYRQQRIKDKETMMEIRNTFKISKFKWVKQFIYGAVFCWCLGLFHHVITPAFAASEYTDLPIAKNKIDIKNQPSVSAADDENAQNAQNAQNAYDDGYDRGYEQALTEIEKEKAKEKRQKKAVVAVKSELSIETVALTPNELAKVEYLNAEKALDQENSKQAALNLESALYYRPDWIMARQKLAALYYGRGDIQEAIATLERGLARQPNQANLRLTLAKLLINESQLQAALTVLNERSGDMSIEYLAMRGALAQQLDNNEIALSCYQTLISRAPKDGRWWMGLAIVQERTKALAQAVMSYNKALVVGNISSASALFIQQRLAAIIKQQQQQQQQHKA